MDDIDRKKGEPQPTFKIVIIIDRLISLKLASR
jgi:hypothetical protein